MKLAHIHNDAYKVFQDFDIDFRHNGKAQNLIVITDINGSGETTLLRDVIPKADFPTTMDGYVEMEDGDKIIPFFLSIADENDINNKVFSNIILYKADELSSVN